MANGGIPEVPGAARLQGWKEIAHYLGVTIRTAQLWETEKGLPVRRLGGERGRVYALPQELQAWMETGPAVAPEAAAEPPEPAPVKRRWLVWGLGGLVLCALVWMAWRGWRAPRVAAARAEGRLLSALDAQGREVWKAVLPGDPVRMDTAGGRTPAVQVLDVDSDGLFEVVVALANETGTGSDEVACYSARGDLRWRWRAGGAVRTRKETVTGGFRVVHVLPWASPRTQGVIVTSVSDSTHPTQVALLDSDGRLLRQYWHAGHLRLHLLADTDRNGRQELWLGGISNAENRAVVVVLDPETMAGAGSESNPDYRFLELGEPREVARLLLYRTEFSKKSAPFNGVHKIAPEGEDVVVFTQEQYPGGGAGSASILYRFAGDGSLKSAAMADNSIAYYQQMVAEKRLDAGAYERDKARLSEVRWMTPWRAHR